jgi:hypothetical protein
MMRLPTPKGITNPQPAPAGPNLKDGQHLLDRLPESGIERAEDRHVPGLGLGGGR